MQSVKSKAFSLLARKAYFSKELSKKLREKGYEEKEIAPLISELKKRGWLNDKELASRYVEGQRRKGYGAKVIAYKLREKAGEIDIPMEESEEALQAFIERRYQKDLPEKREKVIGALLRRGFPYLLIDKVLRNL